MLHLIGKSADGSTFESECLEGPPSQAARSWMAFANAWRTLITMPSSSYRPEAHYMGGPGPKCREKHAPAHQNPHPQYR